MNWISKLLGMSVKPKEPLIIVLGATGTGKSQLAIELAKRFNGEIINGDAMQLYDGLPITTNKVSLEEQQGVPHHLLGRISVLEEPWTVGVYRKQAQDVMRDIRARTRLPIVVGGTHYYLQSLLFKDALLNDGVTHTRDALQQEFPILAGSDAAILSKLQEVDPLMAARWHPSDVRKIRRSLEIYLTTGRKASAMYAEQQAGKQKIFDDSEAQLLNNKDTLLLWVHAEDWVLVERLNKRVDTMLASGLLDEAHELHKTYSAKLAAGTPIDTTRGIWVSIGYSGYRDYLDAKALGNATQDQLQALCALGTEMTKGATRRYAKQQIRWIRLKLLPEVRAAGIYDQLYMLNGTDMKAWDANVGRPAAELVEQFLRGQARPKPQDLSPLAAQYLGHDADKTGSGSEEEPFREECAHCHVVCVRREQWDAHIKSRRHRAAVKRANHAIGGRVRGPVSPQLGKAGQEV